MAPPAPPRASFWVAVIVPELPGAMLIRVATSPEVIEQRGLLILLAITTGYRLLSPATSISSPPWGKVTDVTRVRLVEANCTLVQFNWSAVVDTGCSFQSQQWPVTSGK